MGEDEGLEGWDGVGDMGSEGGSLFWLWGCLVFDGGRGRECLDWCRILIV